MRRRLRTGKRTRWTAAVIAGAVAVFIAGCGESPPAVGPLPHPFFGVNAQSLIRLAEDGREKELARQLDQVEQGGLGFVRANIDWTRLEPRSPRGGKADYDFTGLDLWMRELAKRDLHWQLTAVGVPTPRWAAKSADYAACDYRAAPATSEPFAAMAGALAARYGRDGTFWRDNPKLAKVPVREFEIWNEPNFASFWCPEPNPANYARLLDAASRAIHARDKSAHVLLGGLAGFRDSLASSPGTPGHIDATSFLRAVVAAEPRLKNELDGVAVHAYAANATDVLGYLPYYRDALDAAGIGDLPISLNETGWYTEGNGATPPISDAERATFLAEVAEGVAHSGCNISSFAPHTWTTAEKDPASIEDWYGIADPVTGEPKASGEAYLRAVSATHAKPRRSSGC